MTTTAAARVPAAMLKDEFVRMRAEGASLREIGSEYGFTYEMVRQTLGADDPSRDSDWKARPARERDDLLARVSDWLVEHGPVPRDIVRSTFGLTEEQMGALVAAGLPAHLVILPARVRSSEFSTQDMTAAIRRVWDAVKEHDPSASGLSHATYDKLRAQSEPSAPLIVSRMGWDAACEVADVPSGRGNRPKSSYVSSWSDDDILHVIGEYIDWAVASGMRPTYNRYDEYQRGHSGAPSGSTVRNRMRALGVTVWPDIVDMALRLRRERAV